MDINMKKTRQKIWTTVLVTALLISGMSSPRYADAAKKVKLNKSKVTVTVKKKVKLKLVNTKKKVTWSTKNKKIAKVSKKGVITGRKKGTTKVIAKCAKKKYTCKVTVKAAITGSQVSNNPTPTTKPSTSTPTTSTEEGEITATFSTTSSQAMPSKSAVDTLTVGKMAVRIGMSKSEVETSIGAKPDRMGMSQMGYDVYIYNPSADYTNYLTIGFLDNKVVQMCTISPYFTYEDVVCAKQNSTLLSASEGWKESNTYFKISDEGNTTVSGAVAAYAYTSEGNSAAIAFNDFHGNGDIYGIMVYDKSIKLDDLCKTSTGQYTAAVISSMEYQIHDFVSAYRVYNNVTLGNKVLKYMKSTNTVAKQIATTFADTNAVDLTSSQNLPSMLSTGGVKNVNICGYNSAAHCPDALSVVQSWIGGAAYRSRMLNMPSTKVGNRAYTHTGIGVAYNSLFSDEVYVMQIFYTIK